MSLAEFLKSHQPAIVVRLASAKGSTPREAGTAMGVSETAIFGTIGGGQFEWLAIDHARALLAGKKHETRLDIPLGADIGQCCGGRAVLAFEQATAALIDALAQDEARSAAAMPRVHIFGAGPVGRALAAALQLLPVSPIVYDARQSELAQLPDGVSRRQTALPEADVRAARPGDAFVILTHDHALDFMIAAEALGRSDTGYVGMIGSKTKRATFSSWFLRQGGTKDTLARLICPIGASPLKDKRPEVIAALTAAELITRLNAPETARKTAHDRSRAPA